MNIMRSFQGSNFVQFCISSMLYMYVQKNPRSYFIGKFRSIRRKPRYQFYLARNKTAEIMEEVFKVAPKNLRKNFRVEELFLQDYFHGFSATRKKW